MLDKKIRVLHIGPSSNPGGIESVVKSWVINKPENIQFDFVNLEKIPLAYEDVLIKNGCNIYNATSRKANPFKSKKEIKKIIEDGNYDYVQQHIMSLSWLTPAYLCNTANKAQPLLHSHTVIDEKYWGIKRKLLHKLGILRLKNLNCLKTACSEAAGRSMFGSNLFSVIPNGVDFEKFKFDSANRRTIREKYQIKNSDFLIGHIGRSCIEKNYPFILKSLSEVIKLNENIKLMLIGEVDNDAKIKDLINELNLNENVVFTGKINDTFKYYSAMDLFFLPSLFEGVSVALIEAQANGLPCVVSTNVAKESAISDLVEFIDIDDPNKAAQIINGKLMIKNDRANHKLNMDYDVKNSANKMFEFYLNNLK